jgi:diguanylate cyclase (GGDEF)-like protein
MPFAHSSQRFPSKTRRLFQPSWRFASPFEITVFVLALLTGCAVLGQEWLVNRSLTIGPGSRYPVEVSGDKLVGGSSQARWLDRGARCWECEIKPGFAYPFCSFQVSTGGIDLSPYTHLSAHIRYQGEAKTIRIFLRNWNPAYSRLGDPNTLKFNQIEIQTSELAGPATIPLADFQVASWWLLEHKVPLQHSKPEFGSVAVIEIQTGTGSPQGLHRFEISGLEFRGKWISTERFYLGLLVLWLTVIFGGLLRRLWGLRAEVERRRAREGELVELNRLLDVETRALALEARTDPLTGASNRAGIRDMLSEAADNWQQHNRPLSIILIDLDNFREVNDSRGHTAGDEVLIAVVRLLRGRIRSSDTLVRWGGDEFVVICRDTALQDAATLARSLRDTLGKTLLLDRVPITASFGVASLAEDSISNMFHRADKALYEAKNAGRNMVNVNSPATLVGCSSD